MKKTIFILFCITIILSLSIGLFGCEKKEQEKDYIVLSFVTGCEINIEPIILDGSEKFMPDDPMRAGYDFLGWYYDEACTRKFNLSDGLSEDTTIYAKWYKKVSTSTDPSTPLKDAEGIEYSEDGNTLVVVGYKGTGSTLSIPGRFNGKPVMKIADNAFAGTTLKEVRFGENISTVAEYAFKGSNLEKIEVTDGNLYFASKNGILYNKEYTSLIRIPSKNSVKNIVLNDVTYIYPYALQGCTCEVTLKKYAIIEGFAFGEFDGTVIFNGVNEIRKDAFNGATCKVIFETSSNVTALRNGAFAGYKGEKLTLPSTVSTIEWQAFYGCKAVVDLSQTFISVIGEKAFAGYEGKTLLIPACVTTIEKNAFYGAKTAITFEEGSLYTTVAEEAFAHFGISETAGTYTSTVIFPSSVTTVEKNAFYGSYSYVHFSSTEENMNLDALAFNQHKGKKYFL